MADRNFRDNFVRRSRHLQDNLINKNGVLQGEATDKCEPKANNHSEPSKAI